ncbi:MAG: hypothetical protein ACQEQV_10480 [Fibrobacterota bacterium]
MNIRTGSKNSIENRGAKTVMTCSACGEERKPVRVMALNSKKMAYECKCGLLDRSGNEINL